LWFSLGHGQFIISWDCYQLFATSSSLSDGEARRWGGVWGQYKPKSTLRELVHKGDETHLPKHGEGGVPTVLGGI
jgi:hypothetical protein